MNKSELHIKIVLLFKYFDNNYNILVKYLIDNNSFNEDFLKNIYNSDFLKESDKHKFKNISEIDNFLLSILLEQENEKELISKLEKLIENEEYEKAAKLRDYIFKNNNNNK
jgi:hypothetical protein